GDQQRPPTLLRIALHAAVEHLRHLDPELAQAHQRIALTQHRGPAERIQQAAVDMADLPLGIEQAPTFFAQALDPAPTTATLVGLLDPLTLPLPPVRKLLDCLS